MLKITYQLRLAQSAEREIVNMSRLLIAQIMINTTHHCQIVETETSAVAHDGEEFFGERSEFLDRYIPIQCGFDDAGVPLPVKAVRKDDVSAANKPP